MDSVKKATILLVDDEAQLNKLMRDYLSRLGYTVETALCAADALSTFESDPTRFQLLVADLTLPDHSGEDMAVTMSEQNAALRVLLCSGYPVTVDSLPEPLKKRFASLQKPFLPNMLAKAIEDLMKRNIE
jgi:DNA-binding NtrC family response regulator